MTTKRKADNVISTDLSNLKDLDDRALLLLLIALVNQIYTMMNERS